MDFADFWSRIRSIPPGTIVPNWTAHGLHFADDFTIAEAEPEYVVIAGPRVRVPKKDFEAVFEIWQAYCHHAVQRRELRAITHHVNYVISIMRFIEDGKMPGPCAFAAI